ncbi:MAG: S41 family peptidase [Eubacteriales bacterium]|jgi:carboxyl-terminal processing protease|nr:S41 family peptidase [Eubacteriales bacterium]MDD3109592.1 S41 family peptidase [Eubacteriales bacterium]MDD3571914.1 S41 family peptidase [Eubacteriales bacterium]MDD4134408.1 S41 family peptidase [Eubacteriales bacterium]NLO13542.1 S41 family peptidase [Clostridiales bacterium]
MKDRRRALWLALALAAVLLLPMLSASSFWQNNPAEVGDTVTISRKEYERLKQYELLDEVKNYVDTYFYEEPDQQLLMDGAIQGLLSGLNDAYSFYYPEEAWTQMHEEDEGKYAGIGVQMLGDYDSGAVTITRVFRNTPAEAAGLKKGDVFLTVEDIQVTTATMQDAVNIMRGIPGEKVHIEVVRQGEVLPFDLIKAEITVNRVEYMMLDHQVGYIVLFEFAGGSAEAFTAAYQELTAQGMNALIVDLRDNPGGWVDDGVKIADLFLDHKLIYYAEDRAGSQEKFYTTNGKDDIPLVFLVNENSASSSEIVTAALKDYKRATVIGEKTFGKGIIQYVIPLSDNKSGFQFTYAQYFSPLGYKVHKEGVVPDIIVEMPEDLKSMFFELGDMTDPQLARAYEEARKFGE